MMADPAGSYAFSRYGENNTKEVKRNEAEKSLCCAVIEYGMQIIQSDICDDDHHHLRYHLC